MTHRELLNIAFIVHGAVLSGSLAAWYKYGVGSDVMTKSLKETEATLSKLRIMISDYLLSIIKKALSTIPTNMEQLILGPDGKKFIYSEKVANFLESERFRQSIMDSVVHRVGLISDYQVLVRARENWCKWAKFLRRSILLLINLQILFLIVHGFIDKLVGQSLPEWCIYASLLVTVFIVLFMFCVLFPFLLWIQNVIAQQKDKYDAL